MIIGLDFYLTSISYWNKVLSYKVNAYLNFGTIYYLFEVGVTHYPIAIIV